MKKNSSDSLVSVVVPVFNAGETIEECLKSLLSQTYKNLEIIVINDGSTDTTKDILNRLSQKNPITVINLEHKGRSSAKNIGINYAKGEIIAFGEADAKYHPEWLTNAIKYFDNQIVAGVVGPRYSWIVDTLVSRCIDLQLKIRYHDPSFNPIAGWIYRKKVLLEVGAFDPHLKVAEDRDLGMRMKTKGYQIAFAASSLMYHMEPRSITELIRKTYTHSKERLSFYVKHPQKYPFLKVFSFLTYIALILFSSIVCTPLFLSLIGLGIVVILSQFLRLYVKAGRSGLKPQGRYILLTSILDIIRNTFFVLGALDGLPAYTRYKLGKIF